MKKKILLTRRSLIKSSAAALGAAAMGSTLGRRAFADDYPAHNIKVAIPTGEGGQVDRAARAFTGVWSKHLGTDFEFNYYPGASGQVGYEIFVGKLSRDGYSLLFGNIGPEMIMYATQNPNYKFPQDYFYFASVDVDDAVIWVANDSPYKTIQDLVEAGKKKTINFSTSRLPHPASLGVLALAEATGASFKLIPYGGGSKARSAALTGECDACATFMGSSVKLDDQIRFLTVFSKQNRLPNRTDDCPPVNTVFNTHIPSLSGSRAWAVHTEFANQYPDRYKKLVDTAHATFGDPTYQAALKKAKIPLEFAVWGDKAECTATADEIVTLATKYAPLLKGTK